MDILTTITKTIYGQLKSLRKHNSSRMHTIHLITVHVGATKGVTIVAGVDVHPRHSHSHETSCLHLLNVTNDGMFTFVSFRVLPVLIRYRIQELLDWSYFRQEFKTSPTTGVFEQNV